MVDELFADALSTLRAECALLPTPLAARCLPALTRLEGDFSRIVVGLPYWLAEVMPLAPENIQRLGLAGLYGWWYGDALDRLIDSEVDPVVLLPAQHAMLHMLALYRELGLSDAAWAEFERCAALAAGAYLRELTSRAENLTELRAEQLATWDISLIQDRAAPFIFMVSAQATLSEPPPAAELTAAIVAALRCFVAARQIVDDASDWLKDLERGQLNYVSTALIRHFLAHYGPGAHNELSCERLAGYATLSEPFWETLQAHHDALCRDALATTERYGAARLGRVLHMQYEQNSAGWIRARTARATMRALFSLPEG